MADCRQGTPEAHQQKSSKNHRKRRPGRDKQLLKSDLQCYALINKQRPKHDMIQRLVCSNP